MKCFRAFFLGAFALVVSCRSNANTAQGVAERFVEAHYVHMNLHDAQGYAVGPAQSKVAEEQKLIGDQAIDESTRKPSVTYVLKETRPEAADQVIFVFEGTIRIEDADTFTRQWLVSTRLQADGQWKVSNFQDFDTRE